MAELNRDKAVVFIAGINTRGYPSNPVRQGNC
jgi:hypothetical protein